MLGSFTELPRPQAESGSVDVHGVGGAAATVRARGWTTVGSRGSAGCTMPPRR